MKTEGQAMKDATFKRHSGPFTPLVWVAIGFILSAMLMGISMVTAQAKTGICPSGYSASSHGGGEPGQIQAVAKQFPGTVQVVVSNSQGNIDDVVFCPQKPAGAVDWLLSAPWWFWCLPLLAGAMVAILCSGALKAHREYHRDLKKMNREVHQIGAGGK